VHIPRTGGTSIEFQLRQSDPGLLGKKHESLFDIKERFDPTGYFKFSFIRNPWDIVISKYFAPFYREINILSGKTLLYFLNNYYRAKKEAGDSFFDYFDPSELDFIGRFETRANDLKYISKKIGIKINSDFSVKAKEMQRAKSSKSFHEYYDEETRNIVYQQYKDDIDFFGYQFPF